MSEQWDKSLIKEIYDKIEKKKDKTKFDKYPKCNNNNLKIKDISGELRLRCEICKKNWKVTDFY